MKKIIIALITIAILQPAFAQNNPQSPKPFHLSLVQSVSTDGKESQHTDYRLSLNILSGTVRSIRGVEIGMLYNQNKGDMVGFQTSGVVNVTQGHVKGVQIGSIYNRAGIVKGFQIGLINIADSVEHGGGGVGLVNLYRKGGYREIEVSVADYQNIGVSFKSGSPNFYTIINMGYSVVPASLFSAGLGIGGLMKVKNNWYFKSEIMWYTYTTQLFGASENTNATHFKFGVMRRAGNVGFTLMPSIYYANIPKASEGDLSKISPINPFTKGTNGRWGFGVALGVAFLK